MKYRRSRLELAAVVAKMIFGATKNQIIKDVKGWRCPAPEQLMPAGVSPHRTKISRRNMTSAPAVHNDKNMPHKRPSKSFGTNRGAHWTVAGSVTILILGGYFIYSSRDSNPTIAGATPAVEQIPVSASPVQEN
jgi:hypothetical protein